MLPTLRRIANFLVLLSVMVGLALPNAMARSHEVSCATPESCDNRLANDCHDCPPPTDCGDHDHEAPVTPSSDEPCPSPDHRHHHHHQCVCTAANAWLIAAGDPMALHPPRHGSVDPISLSLFCPEVPPSVFERPPIS